MKLFLLILLVVIIMLIAKGVANQYKERNLFFVNILKFLNSYELNIGFKKEKILSLVESLEVNGQAKLLFELYKNYLQQKEELDFNKIKLITEDEKIFLKDMFYKIGTNDYSTEMTQLKVFKTYIQDKIDITLNESNKFYPLIIKLSFLFALTLFIVFI